MNFAIKTFNELTIDELYEIVKSRFEVFVCEQKIVEDQEFDDKDKVSYHIMLKENDKVVAYCRIVPKEIGYDYTSIGRVLVLSSYRRKGIAQEMIKVALDFIKNNFSFEKFNTFDKILVQNEKSDFVYIIIKGKVKVYSLTPTGVKYLERIYCEYEIFGELEAFIDKPILNYVEAIESCNAIKIPKDLFLKWIEIDREFSLYISIQISEKMYYTSINSRANVTYPLKSRLIFFLWNFLDEHNLDTVHKDILVEGVGSNIRSVNRIIKELVNEGLIEYNKGFIKVKNMDKLMDLIMSPNPNKPNFNNQN